MNRVFFSIVAPRYNRYPGATIEKTRSSGVHLNLNSLIKANLPFLEGVAKVGPNSALPLPNLAYDTSHLINQNKEEFEKGDPWVNFGHSNVP